MASDARTSMTCMYWICLYKAGLERNRISLWSVRVV